MSEEETLTLAFFDAPYFIVSQETGAILTSMPGHDYSNFNAPGWERVTREQLFDRWPEWKRSHERLMRRLGEQGIA